MTYQLNNLNHLDFEYLIQALVKKIIGNGTITFGSGPDGGREATYSGQAPYPSPSNKWSGHWVFQAKFRGIKSESESKEFAWIEKEINKDVLKHKTRQSKVEHPNNLIFFTNIILTPTANTGGLDKAEVLCKRIESKYTIDNVRILGFDEINTFLNTYRDVAVSFGAFILPGDILFKLYELSNKDSKKVNTLLGKYLETEFRHNLYPKLEHAGKVTSDKINLEKVFIDLQVISDRDRQLDSENKFIHNAVRLGNTILLNDRKVFSRQVLIAGPGYGKSTLTQFLCQIYRAFFLKYLDSNVPVLTDVEEFWKDYDDLLDIKPTVFRFPFRITLKEYASWLKENQEKNKSYTIVSYICYSINKNCSSNYFNVDNIDELFELLPWLVIFDGLDEVPNSSNRQQVMSEINDFTDIYLRRIKNDTLIIGTSRPQGYSQEFSKDIYNHYLIGDLSETDCKDYMYRLLNNIEEDADKRVELLKILHKALNDQIVSRLMKTPLQASIMTILVRSGGEPPRNKYELFNEYYSTIFRREKQKNVANVLNENPEYINGIHNKLGFGLQNLSESSSNPSAIITIDEFRKFIAAYLLNDIGGLTTNDIDNISKEINDAVIERLVFIEELQENKIGFTIRSVQEFFAANYYLMHQQDLTLLPKLKQISVSSYWNNTFLFSIGYLFKNRAYAISYVEAICNELNGSSNNFDENTIESLYKHGSWLALDILNENIFRTRPLLENLFARMLKELLYIPFIAKHNDLLKLPNVIIERWLLPQINECIQTTDVQIKDTCFIILSGLSSNYSLDFSYYIKYWASEIESAKNTLSLILKNSTLHSPLGIHLLHNEISRTPFLYLIPILNKCNDSLLTDIYKTNGSQKIAQEILSCIFLRLTQRVLSSSRISEELLEVLFKPVINFKAENIVSIMQERRTMNIKISSALSASIYSILDNNKAAFTIWNKVAKYYNIEIFEAYCKFYMNPDKEKLFSFLTLYYSHDIEQREYLYYLIDSNWLFSKIYQDVESMGGIDKISKSKYGDLQEWNAVEKKYSRSAINNDDINLLYNLGWHSINSLHLHDGVKSYMNEVAVKNKRVLSSPLILLRIFVLGCIEPNNSDSSLFHKEEILMKILEAIKFYKLNNHYNSYNYFNSILNLVYKSTDAFIDQNISEIEACSENIHIDREYYLINRNSEYKVIYEKLVTTLIRHKITFKNSPLIKLLPTLLRESDNFHELKDYDIDLIMQGAEVSNLSNEHCFSLLCLLVIHVQTNKQKEEKVLSILNIVQFSDISLKSFLTILKKLKANEGLENILLKINNRKVLDNYNKSLYIELLKDYSESRSSNIQFNLF